MTQPTKPDLFIPNLAGLVPETSDQTIISKRVHQDDNVTVILFSFAPGEELSEHTSKFPAILHFLSGSAEITLGDEPQTVTAGAWATHACPPAAQYSRRHARDDAIVHAQKRRVAHAWT